MKIPVLVAFITTWMFWEQKRLTSEYILIHLRSVGIASTELLSNFSVAPNPVEKYFVINYSLMKPGQVLIKHRHERS